MVIKDINKIKGIKSAWQAKLKINDKFKKLMIPSRVNGTDAPEIADTQKDHYKKIWMPLLIERDELPFLQEPYV